MSGADLVDRLAQSIADGSPIDWAEIDKLPADARLRQLFGLLRVVDGVAEVHRSLDATPRETDSADVSTYPFELEQLIGGIGQWGHLLLRRKIGEGGFGEVYHAHDIWLDHPVALKLFKPAIASPQAANRILHEARTLARIRHPNVVTVHGADSHNGRVGFWMDLIEGATLENIVQTGCLSAGEAAHIGQEVCRALAAVHHAGIIHRDVKAQNVMRAYDGGRIILMDFGAGELMKGKPTDWPRQGTPRYLAPEIFEGQDASVQSDIYAVGVMLYFLVSGAFPVRRASLPELIDAHRRGDLRRLRDVRPDAPAPFVSIVERALDPDPARRFGSAGEMEAALAGAPAAGIEPITLTRLGAATEERTGVQKITQVGVAVAVAIGMTGVLGLIACRGLEVALGIEPDFAAGVTDYFSIGVSALVPFAFWWLAGAAVFGTLVAIRPLLRGPLAAVRRPLAVVGAIDSETAATLVFLAGAVSWVAITMWCSSIFAALESLRVGAATATDLSVLSSTGRPLHLILSNYSAYLSFFLGWALWRWFPTFEKNASDRARVRLLKWATLAVAFLAVATATMPRRFLWENFEVVRFEKQPSFVIGSSGDELLLYYPYNDTLKHRRVRRTAPELERTGARARIFDRQ